MVQVEKNLVGSEDLTTGMGTVTQSRGGVEVEITQINAGNIPYSETQSITEKIEDIQPVPGINFGVLDPGVTILTQGTPDYTFSVADITYYTGDGVGRTLSGATNVNPNFTAGQEFAYIGVNQDGLIIKKQLAFTPADLEGRSDSITPGKPILALGIVRSIAGGPDSTLEIQSDSPYFLDTYQKRLSVKAQFSGTEYSEVAAKVSQSATAKQLNISGGDYLDGNMELKSITSTNDVSGSNIVYNGTSYDIQPPSTIVVDSDNYNPGSGLVAIPTGKFVSHTILHSIRTNALFVVYGKIAYDSYSEAMSAEEDLGPVAGQVIADVNAISLIVVKQGEAVIRDIRDIRHKNGADNTPTLTEGTQNISTTFNGSVREKMQLSYRQSGGNIFADLEKDGGGDLTVQLDGSSYMLDCTTGGGIGGKATVQLTLGTSTLLQENWIYIAIVGGVPTLMNSTTQVTGDVAVVGKCNLLDLARFTSSGDEPVTSQQYNNSASLNGQGLFARTAERIRKDGPKYISGVTPSLSITTNGGSIDTVELSSTAGIVYQFNRNTFDELTTASKFIVINHPTTPYLEVNSLDEIDVDATGTTLRANNDRYGLNILAGQNSGGAEDRYYVLLPEGKYNSDGDALQDVNNFAVTAVNQNLGETVFRLCRAVLKYSTASGGTITNLVGGSSVQDERGFPLGQGGSGGSGGGTLTDFSDGSFSVFSSGDATKIMVFDVSGVSPATTRTLSIPDDDGTIALGTIAEFEAILT